MEQQSNLYTGVLMSVSKLAVWAPSAQGTEPNSTQQVWYVGFKINIIIWNVLRVDIYMKIK